VGGYGGEGGGCNMQGLIFIDGLLEQLYKLFYLCGGGAGRL
jgi:hypothetical protein